VSAPPFPAVRTTTARFSWRQCWSVAALAAYLITRFAPPLEGLSAPGQAVLGVMLAGGMLWVSEAIPIGLTAIVVLILIALSPGLKLADATGGFASQVVFFLIGAVALGTAVEASGLAARAARFLIRMARGGPARLYVQMIASLPALALLMPSAITRNAILIPAYRDALDHMGVSQNDSTGRTLMLALGVLNPLASSALLTGGITSITAASLLGGFSWLRWLALMAVPYYALLAGGALFLRLMVGRFEPARDSNTITAATPFSAAEIKTLAVLAATSALWLTDSWHKLSPAIPALIGGTLLLMPVVGVLTWKTFEGRLSWGLILTVGASLSLASAMTRSGAAGWIGHEVVGGLAGATGQPHMLIVGLITAVVIVHLAITNLAACIALLLPITSTIAAQAGLNPVVCGLVVTITVDAVILYPVQTASNLLAYESGYFSSTDVRRLGFGMLALTIAVVLLAIPYWNLAGMPLTLR
jgi:solute carrier family 13 (sodium-dependent dicarboxylate transporter), member 2/3/5